MKNSLKTFPLLLAVLAAMALCAPAAFAQSSLDGYIEGGPSVIDETSSGTNPGDGNGNGNDNATGTSSGTDPSASLPFTGLDLGLIGIAGASLLVLGVGMRRMTRANEAA